jgi:hypothetical protein
MTRSRRAYASAFTLLAGLATTAFVAVLGCSSSGSTYGNNQEAPFSVADQIYFLDGAGSNTWEVKLTSYSGACALEQAGDSKKQNSDYILVKIEGMSDAMPSPGTYMLGSNASGITLEVQLKQGDATCNDTETDADSATLDLTASTASGATGTLTASIKGMPVQFAFNAAGCTRDDSVASSCVP